MAEESSFEEPSHADSSTTAPASPFGTPVPTPAPAKSPTELAIEQAMRASYESGSIREFAQTKPVKWTAGPDETIRGTAYQTGVLEYSTKTILGEKVAQAKALILNGKVDKWISLKTSQPLN